MLWPRSAYMFSPWSSPVTPCATLRWDLNLLYAVPNTASKCLVNDAKWLTGNFAVLVIDDCIKRGRNKVISNPHTQLNPSWISRYSPPSFSVWLGSSTPLCSSQKFSLFTSDPLALLVTEWHKQRFSNFYCYNYFKQPVLSGRPLPFKTTVLAYWWWFLSK